ncbi:MAG: HD domain-containing protein [Deltaproteobacteria bacterium]|nr:HD domain-containing protein [Deltaproteobacteria bacterium]MBW2018642.1 HD domain-containing protein [Deltaproteobacteria bacterium]MBW2073908.1 HD domain-containing protein [Deltaproteobacteria bacterium]RLB81851.1 MAG: metal-dependent phosphohydrolase [Deltaproteobacteria bacterium]
MKAIANLLFEARILKDIPRSGFHFLGSGDESVAEHSFMTTFIAYVFSQIVPEANALKLLQMCLIHDLTEARIGDLNYVQKKYLSADETRATSDLTKDLSFGKDVAALLGEFNAGKTLEAQLAHDADQLALILELKALYDAGNNRPRTWLPHVVDRLKTGVGQSLAKQILKTASDEWWFEDKAD